MIDADGNIGALRSDLLVLTPDGATIRTIAAGGIGTQFPAAVVPGGGWVVPSLSALTMFRSDGTVAWQKEASSPPIIDADGNVYVVNGDCVATAYGPDGVQRWTLPLAPERPHCGGLVMGNDATLYVTSESAGIFAVGD
jgi:outer membrane protein assembly factor BamB